MHECLLCKKDMKVSKDIFGSGCIKNIYLLLGLDMPRRVKLREKVLHEKIMKLTNTKNLNSQQKIWLTDRYLTYQYLSQMPYGNFKSIKEQINYDLQNIKEMDVDNKFKSFKSISLKQAYDLYKKVIKFQNNIKKLKKCDFTDSEKTRLLISSFSFIFNVSRNRKQYEKNVFRAMQFVFWQTVIEVGSKSFNYELAAQLLQNSLEEKPKDYIIREESVLQKIKNDTNFKSKIKEIVTKHDKENNFYIPVGKEIVVFEDTDLYFALHIANMEVSAEEKDISDWQMDVKLSDVFDFTKFKMPKDYYDDAKSIEQSMLSSILYNFAYISYKQGVIKEYKVIAKLLIRVKDGKIID